MSNRSLLSFYILAISVVVLIGGCTTFTVTVPPEVHDPDVPLGPLPPSTVTTLHGSVSLQGVKQLARSVSVQVGDQHLVTTDGQFAVGGLVPGVHKVIITTDHFRTYTEDILVTAEPVALEVVLLTQYTEHELDLFARLVYAESAGEPPLGQIAVAASVLNRVLNPLYPNTLEGVIMQTVSVNGIEYYQYSPVLDGRIWELDPVGQEPAYTGAMEAVYAALGGQDPSLGSTGFFNPDKVGPESWVRTQSPTIKIGNHQFFL